MYIVFLTVGAYCTIFLSLLHIHGQYQLERLPNGLAGVSVSGRPMRKDGFGGCRRWNFSEDAVREGPLFPDREIGPRARLLANIFNDDLHGFADPPCLALACAS